VLKELLIGIERMNFEDVKILVVGDVMLDKFTYGNVNRISPEAPVQVVHAKEENYNVGGAGNVAANVVSLKGNCSLVGVAGEDYYKDILGGLLKEENIDASIIIDKSRPTILKSRFYSMGQQLLRVDYEKVDSLEGNHVDEIISFVKNNKFDIIIVADYAKGMVSKRLMGELVKLNVPILVDPKPQNKELYSGVFMMTPNLKEAREMSSVEGNVEEIGADLVRKFDSHILITRSSDGMSLFLKSGGVKHFPSIAREVYDVSGAGDTVIAVLGLCLASGMNIEESIRVSNAAAGIVVRKVGTAKVNLEELKKVL
tara:strand:+ start:3605 stop:4543 length:939 start_codon:yes stop_codon:yes gene_type:complete